MSANEREPKPDLWDAALKLQELFGDDLVFDERYDVLRRWTGTHWQDTESEKSKIELMMIRVFRKLGLSVSSKTKIGDAIHFAKNRLQREFTPREHVVNFKNGTLPLNRQVDDEGRVTWTLGELSKHNPDDSLVTCLPFDADLSGSHPAIDRFLGETIPDPFALECYKSHVGLALLRDVSMQYSLILKGEPGSGKSVLLLLARLATGATKADMRNFCNPDIFKDDLEGKRARFRYRDLNLAILDEVPSSVLAGEDTFKIMAAHGGVGARAIGKDEAAENQWLPKLLMSTNNSPRFKDVSGAVARRIIPVICPNAVPEARRDANLIHKLADEIPAFSVSCVRAAVRVLNTGYYRKSRSQEAVIDEWALTGNSLRRFVRDMCVLEFDAKVPQSDLYTMYCRVLLEDGAKPLSSESFARELQDMALGVIKDKGRVHSTVKNRELNGSFLKGIRLKTSNDVEGEDFEEDLTNDFSPAILSDEEIAIEVDKLVIAQKFKKAKKLVMRMTDKTNRDQTLNLMRECGYIEEPGSGRYGQQRMFAEVAAAA